MHTLHHCAAQLNLLKQREEQRALLPLAKRAVVLPQAQQKVRAMQREGAD